MKPAQQNMQTSIAPSADSAGPSTPLPVPLPNSSNSNNPPPPPSKPKDPLPAKLAIGAIDLRTPAEEIEFQECETIVRQGWAHFTQVGEALVRIRDKKLYKNEYHSFEFYCRERWGFGRSQGSRYIGAALVQQNLGTIPGIPMPESEAQIRPLIGLPTELAQQAWLNALSWSRDGYVPARLVKRAVRQVLKTEQPAVTAESHANKQQRYRLRQSVRTDFQELLTLLVGGAERDVLIAKVQEIQRLLEALLNPKKSRA
jgi:hypothetical protein